MRSKVSAIISCIIAFCIFSITVCADKLSVSEIIEYNLNESNAGNVQAWIDNTLADNVGKGSEWYAIALSKSDDYNFTEYKASLEAFVGSNDVRSATSRQKYALALLAVGSESDYITEIMENSIGEQGLMSYVYGLHLLNNGCTSTAHTVKSVTEQILSMQLSDGGWAVMGDHGDPDATAMTIQALAVYYNSDENVTTAVDKALQFLSDKQHENGGYKSMGKETSESISQVIIALSALGSDAESDARFIKNGNTLFSALEQFQFDDGSYCHEINGEHNYTSTVQAFMANVAYENGNLFVIDKQDGYTVETTVAANEEIKEITSVTDANSVGEDKEMSFKPFACVVVAVIAVLTCVILILLKKNNRNNFIVVAIVAVIAVAIVLFTDYSTAEEYYQTISEKTNPVGTVTLAINCDKVAGREDYIPESGVILEETEYEFEAGETVYDILVEACRENNIQTEFSGSYVSGINYIYEFDYGELSGWMYFINDEEASVGCDSYVLSDGDRIEWIYSLEMGSDLK